MRKKFIASVTMLVILSVSGCASLPQKFIRKKVKPAHTASAVYLEEGTYKKKFSNDYYYKTHYTMWKSWQGEIVSNLSGNSKRLERAAQEAYSHIEQMSRYLKPEKEAELAPLVQELDSYRRKFESGTVNRTTAMSMRSDIERLERRVANDFYYEKVKDALISDTVDIS